MKRLLIPASFLFLAGCRQPGPELVRPYAPTEEGLTLVYLNPSEPQDQQTLHRLQVRVDKVVDRDDGAQVIFKSYTVGVEPPFQTLTVVKNGGVALLSPDGKHESTLLPEGFPEAASSWVGMGAQFRVLGRGAWNHASLVLPNDRPSDGYWVEAQAPGGRVTRSLYLPGLGEVQTDERQSDGRWVTVNLLAQFGFTEAPQVVPDEAPSEGKAAPQPSKRKAKH